MPQLVIVDGGGAVLDEAARANLASELELAVRNAADHVELARLIEASLIITGAPSLEKVAEAAVAAVGHIFGATGRVVLVGRGRTVRAGPEAPFGAGAIALMAHPQGDEMGGTLEVLRSDRALEPSERLVAAHLHLVTLASAARVLLLAAANEKARERQEIVAIVSHDLRTPLQTFSMGLDAIERTTRGPEKSPIDDTIARMKRGVSAMTRLLEDLLDVSRIHDGHLALRIAPQPIGKLIEELRAQLLPLAEKRQLVLTAEVEPDLRVVCDGERLTQALQNLVGNALCHTKHGSIVVRARRLGEDRVRIEVADTGSGVSPEVRERLFERLYQGESAGRAGGLGLGLYIVQGIAEAHGGRVGVETAAGRGSTFFLELPLEGPPATAPPG